MMKTAEKYRAKGRNMDRTELDNTEMQGMTEGITVQKAKHVEPEAAEKPAAPVKKKKWKKPVLIICAVLLLIVSSGIAIVNHYLNKINHIDNETLSVLSPEEFSKMMETEETDEYIEGYIILDPTENSKSSPAKKETKKQSTAASTAATKAGIAAKIKDLFKESLDTESQGSSEVFVVDWDNSEWDYGDADPQGDDAWIYTADFSGYDWGIADSLGDEDLINIILIGQDSRSSWERERSDTMILLSINPSTHKMALISFLRDLYLPIHDGYEDNRLNTAYLLGGFPYMYECFERNFGLHIDGGVSVDFNQFRNIVDLLGGVDLELTQYEADALIQTIYDSYWDLQYWDDPNYGQPDPTEAETTAEMSSSAEESTKVQETEKTQETVNESSSEETTAEVTSSAPEEERDDPGQSGEADQDETEGSGEGQVDPGNEPDDGPGGDEPDDTEDTEEARETGKAMESEAGTADETPEETVESTEESTEDSTEEKTTESTEAAGKETDPSASLESLVDPSDDPIGGEETGEGESNGTEETPEDVEAGTSEEKTESREEEVPPAEILEDTGREEPVGQTAEKTQTEQSGDGTETFSEENMPDVSNIHAGWCHLDGTQTLAYCRMRYLDDELSRTGRQRLVMSILFDKIRYMDLGSLNGLLNAVLPMVSTDLSNGEIMSYAAQVLPSLSSADLSLNRIPADFNFRCVYIRGMAVVQCNQLWSWYKLKNYLPF